MIWGAIWVILFSTMIVAALIEAWKLFIIATVAWLGVSFIIRIVWEMDNRGK